MAAGDEANVAAVARAEEDAQRLLAELQREGEQVTQGMGAGDASECLAVSYQRPVKNRRPHSIHLGSLGTSSAPLFSTVVIADAIFLVVVSDD